MIYTSYYSNMKQVLGRKPEICFVSIAGYAPNWFEEWCEKMNLPHYQFKKLAPKKEWWQVWHDKFADNLESDESVNFYTEKYYETILSNLDASKIKFELLEKSDRRDVCLLCYETPDKFCHRSLVRKWLNDNGIECAEFTSSKI